MEMEFLISLFSFTTVMTLVVGLAMRSEHAIVRERIRNFELALPEDYEMLSPELRHSIGERVLKPWLRRISKSLSAFMPSSAVTQTEEKLQRAGEPLKLSAQEFLGLKMLSVIVFGFLGVAFFLLNREIGTAVRFLAMLVTLAVGVTLPDSLLNGTIKNRQLIIRKSLPDTLDLLVVSAEAGLGFDAAVSRVVDKVHGPISQEFRKVLDEMRVGKSRTEALRTMANRVGVSDLTTFAAAMYQADVLGTSIAQILRVQAETLRSQRNLRAREAASKMPVKMLVPLVFFIFPAIFVVLLGPAAIQIFRALGSIQR